MKKKTCKISLKQTGHKDPFEAEFILIVEHRLKSKNIMEDRKISHEEGFQCIEIWFEECKVIEKRIEDRFGTNVDEFFKKILRK